MAKQKTIGILTSGGDAPGMNAAIRAVTRYTIQQGNRVIGIRHGYNGLISADLFEMNLRSVSEIIHRGGTMLRTARCLEFMTEEGVQKGKQTCIENGIDGLVTIGGDGTFKGARALCDVGVPCVGIPGTIDNDISCTDYTIGYDTALNTATDMIDKLRDTSRSHDRCSVVEVMGHHAGWLALDTGLACGALSILVPEVPWTFEDDILPRMKATQAAGKHHFIIVMAEGCGGMSAYDLAQRIEEKMGVVTRATVFGHVQRGGSPTNRDRVMASRMGIKAAQLLLAGVGNRVIAYKNGRIVDFDITEALEMKKPFDFDMLEYSNNISI